MAAISGTGAVELPSGHVFDGIVIHGTEDGVSAWNLLDLENLPISHYGSSHTKDGNSITVIATNATSWPYCVFYVDAAEGQYAFMAKADAENARVLIRAYNDTTMVASSGGIGSSVTIEAPEGTTRLEVYLYARNTSVGNVGDAITYSELQLISGSSMRPYAPHGCIRLVVSGKNLASTEYIDYIGTNSSYRAMVLDLHEGETFTAMASLKDGKSLPSNFTVAIWNKGVNYGANTVAILANQNGTGVGKQVALGFGESWDCAMLAVYCPAQPTRKEKFDAILDALDIQVVRGSVDNYERHVRQEVYIDLQGNTLGASDMLTIGPDGHAIINGTVDLGYVELPDVRGASTLSVIAEVEPQIDVELQPYSVAGGGASMNGRNLLRFTESPTYAGNNNSENRKNGWCSWSDNASFENTEDGIKMTSNTGVSGFVMPLAQEGLLKGGADEVVTLSFQYRGTFTVVTSIYLLNLTGGNVVRYSSSAFIASETEWQTFSETFYFPEVGARTSYAVMVPYLHSSGKWLEIKDGTMKLEYGTEATEWRPAPEDLTTASDVIIATDTDTLAVTVDVDKVETFYYQTASTASAPSKPTTASPTGWQATEFAFDATKGVWTCQKTTLSDGTFRWGEVSKWSAYEGAVVSKNAADAAQSTANSANAREQRIYKSAASGTASMAATTTWITSAADAQGAWTAKRPTFSRDYPVLFTATQRQTVAQQAAGSTCTCTTPYVDESAAVAGNYITKVSTGGDAWVHSEGHGPDANGNATANTYGWRIGSVFELVRAGLSYLKMWVDNSVAKVRVGLESAGHSVFSPDGMEVFTDADTSVAKFGATSRIGKPYVSGATDNESYMELTHQGFELHDDSDDIYLDVKDMRDTYYDGDIRVFGMTETFTAEYANQRAYSMTFEPLEIYQLQIDEGTVYYPSTRDYSTFGNMIELGTTNVTLPQSLSIAEGSSVRFTYLTADERSKYITFGTRASGSITGPMSCAFGDEVEASGPWSSAFGRLVSSTGATSHAEGYYTIASNTGSHAEGFGSRAGGYFSHAEGNSVASGDYSHSQNLGTLAAREAQTVIGTYNVEDTSQTTTHPSLATNYGKYALIVGNGASSNARSNAFAVEWDGTIECAGSIECAGTIECASDTAWTTLNSTIKYRIHHGVCYVVGISTNVTQVATGGTVVGTLPTGARPTIDVDGAATTMGNNCGQWKVGTSGQITVWGFGSATKYWAFTASYPL